MGSSLLATRTVVVSMAAALCVAACDDDTVSSNGITRYAEEPFSFRIPVAAGSRFVLQGINGSVRVVGSAPLDSFTVEGERRVGSRTIEDAEAHLDLLQVIVTDLGSELRVETEQPAHSEGRTYIVDYRITVPRAILLRVGNVNGNVSISSILDTVSVGTANGGIDLDGTDGSVFATTANGDVTGRAALPPGGTIDLATVNGDIALTVPVATSAELSATVATGEIEVRNLTIENEVSTGVSLSGTLGGGNGLITLRTTNGDIRVTGASGSRR